jgi:hypothetical protein
MTTDEPGRVENVSNLLSDLYVGLEDLVNEGSVESLLKVLALFQDLRLSMDIFDKSAVAVLRRHDVSWSEIASNLGVTSEDVRQRFQLAREEFGVAEQRLAALLVAHYVLARLLDGHIVWLGFSFADLRIAATRQHQNRQKL